MTLFEAITAFKARVCAGTDYGWDCYGPNARYIDFADADGLECGSIVHDSKTFEVYELTLAIPGQDQAFRWINPAYQTAHDQEATSRGIDPLQAWDHVQFIVVDESTALRYAADVGDTYYDNLPVPETA